MYRRALLGVIACVLFTAVTLGTASAQAPSNAGSDPVSQVDSYDLLIAVLNDAYQSETLSDPLNGFLAELFIEYLIAPETGETPADVQRRLSGLQPYDLVVAVLTESHEDGTLSTRLSDLLSELFIEYLIVPVTGETLDSAKKRLSDELNSESDSKLWTFGPSSAITARPMVHNGTVYIGSESGTLYALYANTGEPAWKYQADASINIGAEISGEVLVFADVTGTVYAVDSSDGKLVWKSDIAFDDILPSLSVDDERVYITVQRRFAAVANVYAINLGDGSLEWEFDPGNYIYSAAAVREGRVYVSVQAQGTYALDAESGDELWLNDRVGSSRFTYADGQNVFLGTPGGIAAALNVLSGSLAWHKRVGGSPTMSATFSEDAAIIANDVGEVLSVSKLVGEFNWIFQRGEHPVHLVPTFLEVAESVVYVGWNDGTVHTLETSTGSVLRTHMLEDGIGRLTTVKDRVVYYASGSEIHAVAAVVPESNVDAPMATQAPAPPTFEPMTPGELASFLEEMAGHDAIPRSNEFRSRLIRAVETGYYLATGRTFAQDSIVVRFVSDSCENVAGTFGTEGRSNILVVCDVFAPSFTMTVMIHESGHALEHILNPLPKALNVQKNISGLSFSEARAQIFEAVVVRDLFEYLGLDIDSGLLDDDQLDDNIVVGEVSDESIAETVHQWIPKYDSNGYHTNIHATAYLLAWLGVLHDEELSDLRQELEGGGRHLSSRSLMDLFNRLNDLDTTALSEYVGLAESPDVSEDADRIGEYINSRDMRSISCTNSHLCVISALHRLTVILP